MSDEEVLDKKPRKKSNLKKILKFSIPLVLGIVILFFLYADTNFNELWAIIKNANWLILTFSLVFGLAGNIIRALRWQLLINPLGYTPKRSNLIYAVLGNYAVNFALPRAGEIWRCGVISKEEKIPFTKLIGTLIIDRIFDGILLLLIILLAFVCNAAKFYENSAQFNLPTFITSPLFYVASMGALIAGVFVLVFFKENVIVKKIRSILQSMWTDLVLVWKMKEKSRFIIYSFSIWLCYFLYFYVTFFAFDFTASLSLSAALFVFALCSVSMVIPSNGGLGPWQAATVFGLCAFMIDVEQAKAFATAVFAFQSIWIVLCGLYGIVMLSVNSKETAK